MRALQEGLRSMWMFFIVDWEGYRAHSVALVW